MKVCYSFYWRANATHQDWISISTRKYAMVFLKANDRHTHTSKSAFRLAHESMLWFLFNAWINDIRLNFRGNALTLARLYDTISPWKYAMVFFLCVCICLVCSAISVPVRVLHTVRPVCICVCVMYLLWRLAKTLTVNCMCSQRRKVLSCNWKAPSLI